MLWERVCVWWVWGGGDSHEIAMIAVLRCLYGCHVAEHLLIQRKAGYTERSGVSKGFLQFHRIKIGVSDCHEYERKPYERVENAEAENMAFCVSDASRVACMM